MDFILYDENKFSDISTAPKDGTMVWLSNESMRKNKIFPVKARYDESQQKWIGHITDYIVSPDKWYPVSVREDVPRAWTKDELCERFVKQIQNIARYWAEIPDKTPLERTEGMSHTILALIDGCTLSFPAINLVPAPDDTDKDFHIKEGENFFEETPFNDCTNLRYLLNK